MREIDKFKYRTLRGRIYEMQENGDWKPLTTTQARDLLNKYYHQLLEHPHLLDTSSQSGK